LIQFIPKFRTRVRDKIVCFRLVLLFVIFLIHCTTVGLHHNTKRESINFGKAAKLRLCVYKDTNLSEETVNGLLVDWQTELNLYSIEVLPVKVMNWKREHFFMDSELEDLLKIPLEEPCDRFVLFLGTNVWDSIFDLLPIGGTVLGAVEGLTATRGYIIADYFSLNQIFSPPSGTIVHEGYHLFGCEHALLLTECYNRILTLKQEHQKKEVKDSFFPAMNFKKQLFLDRNSVNRQIRKKLTRAKDR
jgi:hypothetical protein